MKKLLIFMPSVEGGGVEKNFFLITNYLSKKRKDIYVITAEKNLYKKLKKVNIIYPKSNFWRLGGRYRKYFICILLLINFLKQNHSSVIFSFQANIYAIIISKLFNVKIISRSNSAPIGWSKNFFKKIIYKIGLNLASSLIVNSYEFKKEISKNFNVNSQVIYNPLNKKEILKESKKRPIFKYNRNRIKILSVGRLVDQKDHITLLKSINEIKNKIKLELLIIGRGKNKLNYINFIKSNNLGKIVKIFYTNNPFPYMKQSDLFILTSKFEGLPNVLLEALTFDNFIISSNCHTGPKEILDNNKGGLLFETGNHKELGKKILMYSKEKSKLRKKLTYAKKRLSRFDYYKNLNKYLKIVEKYS